MRKLIPIVSAALLVGAGFAPAADAFTLSIVPQGSTVDVGGTVAVDVVASDLADGVAPSLSAYDLSLAFNSSVLSFDSIVFGTGLSVSGVAGFQDFTPSLGAVNVAEASFDSDADLNALQAGAFRLFTVVFDAEQVGTSVFTLGVNGLVGANGGNVITAEGFQPVSVSVTGAPAVPVPAAGWLLVSGLAGTTGLFARRRRVARQD